jgi:hypothetical protein
MRYIIKLVCVIVIVFAVVCCFGVAFAKDDISVDIEAGFDGKAKINKSSFAVVKIENKGKDIQGEFQIYVPRTNDSSIIYSRKVNIKQGTKDRFIITFPVYTPLKEYEYRLLSNKKTIVEGKFYFEKILNMPSYVILTDRNSGIDFLYNISVSVNTDY